MVAIAARVAPGLPVHGSTQMSVTSAEGAEFVRALAPDSVSRVVLARELSVREIEHAAVNTDAEVCVVHGSALQSTKLLSP